MINMRYETICRVSLLFKGKRNMFVWSACIFNLCLFHGVYVTNAMTSVSSCMTHHDVETGEVLVDCVARNLTEVPLDMDVKTTKLDLSLNNLTNISDYAFSHMNKLTALFMVTTSVSELPPNVFDGLSNLAYLALQGNHIKTFPRKALRNLKNLQLLYLDNNTIESLPDNAFRSLPGLERLRLDANTLTRIPVRALSFATSLEHLDLGINNIEEIPDRAFANLTNLSVLRLHNNKIQHISSKAFSGLPVLELLDLSYNRLTEIPVSLKSLPDLGFLVLSGNQIDFIPDGSFSGNRKLTTVTLVDNPIRSIGHLAFRDLPMLKELVISEARELTEFPDLTGTNQLENIRLDRASISELPDNLCENMNFLLQLDIHSNRITHLPNMSDCTQLLSLHCSNNAITSLEQQQLFGMANLKDLILSHNHIKLISDKTFLGLTKLEFLDLYHNDITFIHEDAFASLSKLRDLNLAENRFPKLPTRGLQELRHLKTFHNKYLVEPPEFDALPKVLTLAMSYAYHCCAFIRKEGRLTDTEGALIKENTIWLQKTNMSANFATEILTSKANESQIVHILTNGGDYYDIAGLNDSDNLTTIGMSVYQGDFVDTIGIQKPPVDCVPLPGPFLPCDDLFGWWSLRCGVWIVFLLAVLGNGAVLFVSITSRSKMDVTRFLICNLAFSDLCMGIYLGFLAIVDASTLGEFEKYALRWQSSPGCLVAGFLGVMSSELSVFTLVVITIERFYAISHAMQLDKRFTLRHTALIMAFGWFICMAIASLPLFEISDYRKFAICLPFETETQLSLGYVCFIMIFNAISFLVIVVCYIGMFVSVRGSHSWNSNDSVVAKRMALLVFTDFFCWAPIIFFSLTAAFETNFTAIGLDGAKILTIFVLPLNSCANPFLYAFFTRQFKRDCVKLCKRIEEASMSRFPTSAVRRSSNGSNRQSQCNTIHKRGSCDNSLREASTSGEASNEFVGCDQPIKRLKFAEDDDAILQCVHPESAFCLDAAKSSSGSSPELEYRDGVPIESLLSPKKGRIILARLRKDGEDDAESGPDIVLHTTEGHIYLNAKNKTPKASPRPKNAPKQPAVKTDSCGYRLCNHNKRSGRRTVGNKGMTKKNNSRKDLPVIKCVDTAETEPKERNTSFIETGKLMSKTPSIKEQFEAERSKQLGLKTDFFRENKDMFETGPDLDKAIVVKRKHMSTQTTHSDVNVRLRRMNILDLPSDMDKRERDKQINEWRKTSHLSFLWRNSGSFDVATQKQKSNSLVELTRPVYDWKGVPSKRHSLSSRHEGYILLKNGSRDSAYEDDELYEINEGRALFVPHPKLRSNANTQVYSMIPEGIHTVRSVIKTSNGPVTENDDECETSMLIPIVRNDSISPVKRKPKNSYDDESGISSSS